MPRYMGIDHGQRRIGLAISDPDGTLASPLATLASTGDPGADARAVVEVADEEGAEAFILGLPYNMNGTEGPQAKICRAFAESLEAASPGRSVTLWDERLSSFAADEALDQTDLSSAKRKAHRDKIAAQKILQSYLESLKRGG
jgi:putative holliday junction resolvase